MPSLTEIQALSTVSLAMNTIHVTVISMCWNRKLDLSGPERCRAR